MRFLERERETLEARMPGLDAWLAETGLEGLETPRGGALARFREAGGPGLLVPAGQGGLGADAVTAVRIQRALGSRSPSLAVATTMHHFSVATLVEMCRTGRGLEGILLTAIAGQRLLVASGFAEGRSRAGILEPSMEARRASNGGGLAVTGSKKPCSLTWSMDLLSASVRMPDAADGDDGEIAVVLVPANAEGLERRRFWCSPILAAAESDEVILRDVPVPERLVFSLGTRRQLHPIQAAGFLWFELLISASYLGSASALVERVLTGERGAATDRVELVTELEGAMAAIEGVAATFGDIGAADSLARMLYVRYAVQQALGRVAPRALEVLGGVAFAGGVEAAHLLVASLALCLHPPTRLPGFEALAASLEGRPLHLR